MRAESTDALKEILKSTVATDGESEKAGDSMVTTLVLLIAQGSLGAFDTVYFHELKARLPCEPSAGRELRLHALRDFVYAVLFGTIGWLTWNGLLAWLLGGFLFAEVVITLCDFLEEDRTRKLPAGERITHALMGIVYGMFIACFAPTLLVWAERDTNFAAVEWNAISWILAFFAAGVLASGVRDLVASARRL